MFKTNAPLLFKILNCLCPSNKKLKPKNTKIPPTHSYPHTIPITKKTSFSFSSSPSRIQAPPQTIYNLNFPIFNLLKLHSPLLQNHNTPPRSTLKCSSLLFAFSSTPLSYLAPLIAAIRYLIYKLLLTNLTNASSTSFNTSFSIGSNIVIISFTV